MAKSKIITDFVNNEVSLEIALKRIILLTSDFEDKSIFVWAKNELGGYLANDDIPKYRVIYGEIRGTFQTLGYGLIQTHRDANLPTIGLNNVEIDELCTGKFTQGIAVLNELSLQNCHKSLPTQLYPIFEKETNINVLNANVTFSKIQIMEILSKIKTTVLDVLVELEKNYGNLDDLDIEQKPSKIQHAIEKDLSRIIYQDNRIQIGDNNRINKTNISGKIDKLLKIVKRKSKNDMN